MKKVMTMVAIATAALVSCNRETGPGHAEEDAAISFTTSAMTVSPARGPVSGTSLDGMEIGIFTVRNLNDAPVWSDTQYVMDDMLGTVIGSKVDYGTAIPYPLGGTTVNFYAYYPYGTVVTNNRATGAAPTIAIAEGGETDYMYAVETNSDKGFTARPGSVMLNFKHAMSLVNIKVQKRQGITEQMTLSEFSLTSPSSQTGVMDMSNGSISTTGSTDVTYTKTGLSVIVPQQGGTGASSANNDISAAVAAYSYMFVPGSSLTLIKLKTDDGRICEGLLSVSSLVRGEAIDLVATMGEKNVIFSIGAAEWKTPDGGGSVGVTEHSVKGIVMVGEQEWRTVDSPVTVGK